MTISWDGEEKLYLRRHLKRYEEHLSGGIAFNSSQAAIAACLETLGSRFQPISVIMPVNVPYDTLQAVIRANGRPVITDIDEWTFQADAKQVADALEASPEAVVLLTRPGGMPVAPGLLEVVQDAPTICDSRILPVEDAMLFTFNIYDISVMVGEGAVVYTKNDEPIKDLRQLRTDSKTELSEVQAALAYQRMPQMHTFPNGDKYAKILDNSSRTGILGFAGNTPHPTYLIKVENVQVVLNRFAELYGQVRDQFGQPVQPLVHGSIPVYKYEIARKRWRQEPNYPVAEKVFGKMLLLPNNDGVDREALLEEIWNTLER